ncbi:MAG: rod-binding protein [Buchnera aphidicola (Floraphis choui)]
MNNDFYFYITPYSNVKNSDKLTTLIQNDQNKTLKIAKQVEGLFLYMMVKSMKNSFPKDTLIKKDQEHIYEDIYDKFITQKVSDKGLGLANIIEEQIKQTNEIEYN